MPVNDQQLGDEIIKEQGQSEMARGGLPPPQQPTNSMWLSLWLGPGDVHREWGVGSICLAYDSPGDKPIDFPILFPVPDIALQNPP